MKHTIETTTVKTNLNITLTVEFKIFVEFTRKNGEIFKGEIVTFNPIKKLAVVNILDGKNQGGLMDIRKEDSDKAIRLRNANYKERGRIKYAGMKNDDDYLCPRCHTVCYGDCRA